MGIWTFACIGSRPCQPINNVTVRGDVTIPSLKCVTPSATHLHKLEAGVKNPLQAHGLQGSLEMRSGEGGSGPGYAWGELSGDHTCIRAGRKSAGEF